MATKKLFAEPLSEFPQDIQDTVNHHIGALVEDPNPTLGGDLSINGYTIDATGGLSILNGNIGIGTTSPLEIVDVYKDTGGAILLSSVNENLWGYIGYTTTGNTVLKLQNGYGPGAISLLTSSTPRLYITYNNIGINTTDQFGGGAGVIGIADATTIPSSNPTGGGVLYVDGGALYYRGSNGTVTKIADA
jgi:hypothetical protein